MSITYNVFSSSHAVGQNNLVMSLPKTRLEWLARDKHSSLFKTFVIYELKMFDNIDTWANLIKLFMSVSYEFP